MNISLIWELTKRDFTDRYSGSVLGLFWSFIWPLVNIFIYTVIFARIMSAKLPGATGPFSYGIYLVAGLVPWIAFANTLTRAATVFVEKKSIITKLNVSLPRLPLYIVLSESITFVITFAIYFVFLVITGHGLSEYILFLPFVFVVQQIFAFGLGFLIATLNVFLRDLKEIIGIVVQVWFWFTPIVYVSSILPQTIKDVLKFNPAYLFVKSYQDILALKQLPNFIYLIVLAILGHVLLLLGYLLFKKLEKDVRDFI